MTIFDDNMKRWREKREAAHAAWKSFSRYRDAVSFVIDEVPGMLLQLDQDSKDMVRYRAKIKKLSDALHAAGVDPATIA